MRTALTFDDVLLVPKTGLLASRKEADISSELVYGLTLELPIVSANMPSVTGVDMAKAMQKAGGFGLLHRFNTIEEAKHDFYWAGFEDGHNYIGCSFGLDDIERTDALYDAGCRTFCLDVAHGDHVRVHKAISEFRNSYGDSAKLIAGNVATTEGARGLVYAGVDAVKVGVGPGAACRTREVTGFGVPQLTAIMNVAELKQERGFKLIADGGIKTSGDIVKALAAGADTVMIGSLLAGCNEAPNPGEYYGSASERINGHRAPEGSYGRVERRGAVEDVLKELAWGIRSGISYGGATDIRSLRKNAEFIQVTAAGQHENGTRLSDPEYAEFYVDQISGVKYRIAT